MGGIPSVVEEVIDSIVDLVGVRGFSVPYILMFATARDDRQSPVQHAFWVDAGGRHFPPDQADDSHEYQWSEYFKERANWLSLPVDQILAHERLEMTIRMSGHVQVNSINIYNISQF